MLELGNRRCTLQDQSDEELALRMQMLSERDRTIRMLQSAMAERDAQLDELQQRLQEAEESQVCCMHTRAAKHVDARGTS